VAGDDVGDRVGDVFGLERLDGLHLAPNGVPGLVTEVVDEFGVDGAGLDDTDADVFLEQFLAEGFRETVETGLGERIDATGRPGDPAGRRASSGESRDAPEGERRRRCRTCPE
jgi:hypothetical protein